MILRGALALGCTLLASCTEQVEMLRKAGLCTVLNKLDPGRLRLWPQRRTGQVCAGRALPRPAGFAWFVYFDEASAIYKLHTAYQAYPLGSFSIPDLVHNNSKLSAEFKSRLSRSTRRDDSHVPSR